MQSAKGKMLFLLIVVVLVASATHAEVGGGSYGRCQGPNGVGYTRSDSGRHQHTNGSQTDHHH
jgi:hypothetical protein